MSHTTARPRQADTSFESQTNDRQAHSRATLPEPHDATRTPRDAYDDSIRHVGRVRMVRSVVASPAGELAAFVVGAPATNARRLLPMSTTSTAVARYQPVLSDVERMTLLGFLAAYRGFTRDAYASNSAPAHCVVLATRSPSVRRPPGRHRMLRSRSRRARQGSGHRGPPVVHDRRVLPLRRRRRRHRPLPGGAHPPTAHRLRVPCLPLRPQRARGDLGLRWFVVSTRSRVGVSARVERAAGVRSDRRQHRSAGPRTRAPHPDRVAQGRQAGHDATGAAGGQGHRSRRW